MISNDTISAISKFNKCETCQQRLIGSVMHYAKKVHWRIRRGTKVAALLPFQLIGKYYLVVVFCQGVVKFHPYFLWLGIVWKLCYCGSQDDLLITCTLLTYQCCSFQFFLLYSSQFQRGNYLWFSLIVGAWFSNQEGLTIINSSKRGVNNSYSP